MHVFHMGQLVDPQIFRLVRFLGASSRIFPDANERLFQKSLGGFRNPELECFFWGR